MLKTDQLVYKNLGFYLLYVTKARFLELGLHMELFDNSELGYVYTNLGGVNEVLRINYSYLFQSFPADYMDLWTVSPELLSNVVINENQKELLFDYILVTIKQEYYKILSELFLFFNINCVFKENPKANYELVFEEKFKNYVKGPKFIGYDEFMVLKDTVRNQDRNSFLSKCRNGFIGLNKLIKVAKESKQLTDDQLSSLESYYKGIVKNSLVFLKLLKTEDLTKLKVQVRFDMVNGVQITL